MECTLTGITYKTAAKVNTVTPRISRLAEYF